MDEFTESIKINFVLQKMADTHSLKSRAVNLSLSLRAFGVNVRSFAADFGITPSNSYFDF